MNKEESYSASFLPFLYQTCSFLLFLHFRSRKMFGELCYLTIPDIDLGWSWGGHQLIIVAIEGRDFQLYSGWCPGLLWMHLGCSFEVVMTSLDGPCCSELGYGMAAVCCGLSKGQDYIIVMSCSWAPWDTRMKKNTGKHEGTLWNQPMASYVMTEGFPLIHFHNLLSSYLLFVGNQYKNWREPNGGVGAARDPTLNHLG